MHSGTRSRLARALATTLAVAACAGCAAPGKYVWVDEYRPATSADEGYVIGPGDLVQLRVFNQDQMSTRARVRADGRITLPLLNDVEAAGRTPVALANELQEALKGYLKAPLVTVSIEEPHAQNVYVAGEVARPGVYALEPTGSVLAMLVTAGGLTDHATRDRIFVLRRPLQTEATGLLATRPARIRFTYAALVQLEGGAATFRLRAGDIVVVE